MTFRANKSGTWVGGDDQSQGTVVYGKSGGNWLYAKEVFAKKDGTWTRAWTDCRKHDEGGRDWTAASPVTEYQGSCTSRESRSRTDYSKTGCTGYSRYTSWVAAPTCEGGCTTAKTGNFSQGGIDYEYSGPAGYYYAFPNPNCSSGCNFSNAYYYVTTCGGTNTITLLSSDPCIDALGNPC
jgi:hypothetical protein